MRRAFVCLSAAAVSAFGFGQLPAAGAGPVVATPAGYRVARAEALHPGVHHFELVKDDGPQRVHVAAVLPNSGVRVVPVLSSGQVASAAPRLERTSSMCLRVECVVAVNADFFNTQNEQPVGGFAVAGELLRSPVNTHSQLFFDTHGKPAAGVISATVRIVATDLQELATPQLNVARGDNALVAYTAAFGPTTRTDAAGAELVGRIMRPSGGLRIGQTAVVKFTELRDAAGDTAIPRDGVVLSGHGTAAAELRDLWRRVTARAISSRALVRVETSPELTDTVGGVPVLVREGRSVATDDGSAFFRERHPRTVVGWTAGGVLLLVTADGRQPGYALGLTLREAADLMVGLGAIEALNLDGGGSTTFVSKGHLANRPSDHLVERSGAQQIVSLMRPTDRALAPVERPTISALAVVVDTSVAHPATNAPAVAADTADDLFVDDVEPPVTRSAPAPTSVDPAPDRSRHLPALVGVATTPAEVEARPLAGVALALVLIVATATVLTWRRQQSL